MPTLKPCLTCGKPTPGRRCPVHESQRNRARDAARGSRDDRGLGWDYRHERDRLVAQAGLTNCPRCDRPITKANPITAEHGRARAHGGETITGLICQICNSSLGAQVRRSES